MESKKVNFRLLFVNKVMDMINLPMIFRYQSLKSFVSFCSIKQPSIVYSFKSSISSKKFNYNDVVRNTLYFLNFLSFFVKIV